MPESTIATLTPWPSASPKISARSKAPNGAPGRARPARRSAEKASPHAGSGRVIGAPPSPAAARAPPAAAAEERIEPVDGKVDRLCIDVTEACDPIGQLPRRIV